MTNHRREFGKLLVFLYVIAGVSQELRRLADNVNSGNPGIDLRSLQEALDRALEQSRARYASRQTPVNSGVLGTNLLADPTKSILMESQPTKPFPDPQTVEASKWLGLIPHPSIVVILGGRGKGKSALGYRLLEHLRWVASVYVVGLPESARKLLPDYAGMVASLEDVPPNSIVLVDEGYLTYHARRSMAATSVEMSQTLNLSRQRNQTLIFVTQEARQIDRNIASSANVVIFKDLGILQLEFDRRELNKIAANAKQAFVTLSGDKRRWSYVYSPDSNFMGLVENSLPTFWGEKLSHIFASGGEIIARAPKKTALSQRIERARELKRQGLSLGQIAKMLGVSRATIKNYLEGYPYKQ
ncbi:MAG: helix-turn-helix domain-containing protein [Dehalococcoidia bacterium]